MEGAGSDSADRGDRWAVEQVIALAPAPPAVAPATAIAVPTRWSDLGADDRAVWGRHHGGSAEPYEVAVDHVDVAVSCNCPSRVTPCKHVLALLLMWCRGEVALTSRPTWLTHTRVRRLSRADASLAASAPESPRGTANGPPVETPSATAEEGDQAEHEPPERARDERIARMAAGLVELDRWVLDRLRGGLADPALARASTWEALAARLTDAQVPALANRVRRIGSRVGIGHGWHEHLLADLAVLHLLAEGGLRLPTLPGPLADGVAVALGWQVRQAAVLEGVPVTDRWLVAGISDAREDRIEVRRTWLWGQRTGTWAMVLSFAAYGQALDESMEVGSALEADLYLYPGALRLRALVGVRRSEERTDEHPPPGTVAQACDRVGAAVAAEPWLERFPFTVHADLVADREVVRARSHPTERRWLLTDHSGSLPLGGAGMAGDVAVLAAAAAHGPVTVTCEWTNLGTVPLTVHLPDRAVRLSASLSGRAA